MSRLSFNSLVANTGAPFVPREAIEDFRRIEELNDVGIQIPPCVLPGPCSHVKASLSIMEDVSRERVMDYQFPALLDRLEDKLHWTRADAEQGFEDTKKFLYICSQGGGPFAPPPRIDKVWHEFILFTEEYGNFCRQCCGRFIHHRPTQRGEKGDGVDYAKKTLDAVESEFGKQFSTNWEKSSACSSCHDGRCSSIGKCSWPCLLMCKSK